MTQHLIDTLNSKAAQEWIARICSNSQREAGYFYRQAAIFLRHNQQSGIAYSHVLRELNKAQNDLEQLTKTLTQLKIGELTKSLLRKSPAFTPRTMFSCMQDTPGIWPASCSSSR